MSGARLRASSCSLFVVFTIAAMRPGTALGAELRVPDQFPGIQLAIDSALPGDTVLVGPGRYLENIQIYGNVVLRSTAGSDATIIDGNGAESAVVQLYGGEIDGFTITGGSAGGMWISGASAVTNSKIVGNSSGYGGGVSIIGYGSPTFTSTVIEGNTAVSGGAVYTWYDGQFTNCVIRGNTATQGGAIYAVYASVLSLVDSTITDNHATYVGGGFYGRSYGWFTLYKSTLSNNSAGDRGGGAFLDDGGELNTYSSVIAGNTAPSGAAVYSVPTAGYGGGRASLNSTTVVGNVASGGGGVLSSTDGIVGVRSSILYGNSSPAVVGPATITYSDVEGGFPGEGNIAADPLFVNAAAGDYHLRAGSPCIDTGVASGWWLMFDIDGMPRPLGAGYDMGADEYGIAYDNDGDGWFQGFGDCNDADPLTYPGAPEIPYDGIDQNCNGMADDDDVDQDGYVRAADCNDNNSSIYPGAPEVNYDGIDQDCDGQDGYIHVTSFQQVQHAPISIGWAQCDKATIARNIVAFPVEEYRQGPQGTDLNRDGDVNDNVLGYYDLNTSQFTNLGVDARWASTDGSIIVYGGVGSAVSYFRIGDSSFNSTPIDGNAWGGGFKSVSGGRIAFVDRSRDVDGDGVNDSQPCVYDTGTRRTTCTGVKGSSETISGNLMAFEKIDTGTIATYDLVTGAVLDTHVVGSGPVIDANYIAFVSPAGKLAYYDVSTATAHETGISHFGTPVSISNGVVVFLAGEGDFWGDLTGDGLRDAWSVVVFYEIKNDRVISTRVRACCGVDISNGVVVFDIYEGDAGVDLNGDTDKDDCVQQYMRLETIVDLPQSTISITSAVYEQRGAELKVTATSGYGAGADLSAIEYGPMSWKATKGEWQLLVTDLYSIPQTVTVTGPEGSATAVVTLQ